MDILRFKALLTKIETLEMYLTSFIVFHTPETLALLQISGTGHYFFLMDYPECISLPLDVGCDTTPKTVNASTDHQQIKL